MLAPRQTISRPEKKSKLSSMRIVRNLVLPIQLGSLDSTHLLDPEWSVATTLSTSSTRLLFAALHQVLTMLFAMKQLTTISSLWLCPNLLTYLPLVWVRIHCNISISLAWPLHRPRIMTPTIQHQTSKLSLPRLRAACKSAMILPLLPTKPPSHHPLPLFHSHKTQAYLPGLYPASLMPPKVNLFEDRPRKTPNCSSPLWYL